MDRRVIGSWLSGPRAALDTDDTALGYPGQRLGLPESGPGSIAPFGRRFGALLIDWLACWFIAEAVVPGAAFSTPEHSNTVSLVLLGVFGLENLLLVGMLGYGLGGRLFGIRVSRLSGGHPHLLAVLIRTALLCLAVPALIWDRDRRGLHDKAAGTAVVRS